MSGFFEPAIPWLQFGPGQPVSIQWLQGFLGELLSASLVGSFLALFVFMLQWLLKSRISVGFLYWIWLLVLLRFAMFWLPTSPTSGLCWMPSTSTLDTHPAAASTEPTVLLPRVSRSLNEDFESATDPHADLSINDKFRHRASQAAERQPPLSRITIAALPSNGSNSQSSWAHYGLIVLFLIWLLGSAYRLSQLAVGGWRLRRLVAQGRPFDLASVRLAEQVARDLQVSHPVRFVITDQLTSPAITGYWHTVVLLPEACLQMLTRSELTMVLTHELIHCRRRDSWWQLLGLLIASFHWFNPLVAWVQRRVESLRELTCDAEVIQWFESSPASANPKDAVEPSQVYGRAVLKLAGMNLPDSPSSTFSTKQPLLSHRFIDTSSNDLKERILMLIHPVRTGQVGWLAGLTSVGLILAVAFTAAPEATAQRPLSVTQITSTETPPIEWPNLDSGSEANRTRPLDVVIPPTPSIGASPVSIQTPIQAEPIRLHSQPLQLPSASPQSPKSINGTGSASHPQVQLTARPAPSAVKTIRLAHRELRAIDAQVPISRVEVSQPECVAVQPISPHSITITGLKPGTCTIGFNSKGANRTTISVEVHCDVQPLQQILTTTFPKKKIRLISTASNLAILRGHVDSTEQATEIVTVAKQMTNLAIVNQLSLAKPIGIEVKALEVRLQQPGVDWKDGKGRQVRSIAEFMEPTAKFHSMAIYRRATPELLQLLEELEKRDVAKVLHEVTLVTRTGKPAEFMSGGEIPIAIGNQKEGQQVEFRPFGTQFSFVPTVADDQRVILEIKAQFSEIDRQLVNPQGVPGFRVRRVSCGIDTRYGQTSVIVGDFKPPQADDDNASERVLLVRPKLLKPQP